MLKGKVRSKPSHLSSPEQPVSAPPAGPRAPLTSAPDEQSLPTALARLAVETFVLEARLPEVSTVPESPLTRGAAACFVCLKTFPGRLRGCIGTVRPARETLAEEIVHNAVGAATRDPRFRPVRADELPLLRYTVDVLESPEPATLEDLDPAEFGVIVEDNTGRRRGLLLPAIEGVESVSQQIQIARHKAGIASGEPLKLYRFRVRRFREPM